MTTPTPDMPSSWNAVAAELRAENAKLREALQQFVAACDTAPPISFLKEIGMASEVARKALEE